MGKACSKQAVSKMIKKSEKMDEQKDAKLYEKKKPSHVSKKRIEDYGKKKK